MVAYSKIALVALAGSVAATPVAQQSGPLALFSELKAVPKSWTSQGAANKDAMVKAQIGLKQSNMDQLQAKLLDISNPESKNYGKWLTKDELNAMTAPPKENIAAVKSWLAAAGITEISQPSPDWIEFSVPVSKMEELLDAKYETFTHATQKLTTARTKQYSVPKELHSMISLITPTTAFYEKIAPTAAKSKKTASHKKRQSCDTSAITPACINSLYDVDYTSQGNAIVATTEFIQVAASHDDYATFGQDYENGNLADFTDISMSGGTNAGSGSQDTLLEGNLDTQFAGGLASPNPNQYLAAGPDGQDFTDQIANFASYLTSTDSPPSAVSTSYGGEEQSFDSSYLDRVCNEFMKAGSLGISVFFSAGDSGVGGNQEASCSNGFYTLWPAVCPWSTAVGGTEFDNGNEVVAQFNLNGYSGSSGGGFSSHFSTPSYQTSDVSSYQSGLNGEYQGMYNAGGRGYPDISLVSKNFQVIVNGQTLSVLGTSASSPSWAALVSVLNDYRKSKGEANLGFINPLLYGNGRSALRDVTSGSNTGCDSSGYPAATGWDAASGLGSLDFAKLRAMI